MQKWHKFEMLVVQNDKQKLTTTTLVQELGIPDYSLNELLECKGMGLIKLTENKDFRTAKFFLTMGEFLQCFYISGNKVFHRILTYTREHRSIEEYIQKFEESFKSSNPFSLQLASNRIQMECISICHLGLPYSCGVHIHVR